MELTSTREETRMQPETTQQPVPTSRLVECVSCGSDMMPGDNGMCDNCIETIARADEARMIEGSMRAHASPVSRLPV